MQPKPASCRPRTIALSNFSLLCFHASVLILLLLGTLTLNFLWNTAALRPLGTLVQRLGWLILGLPPAGIVLGILGVWPSPVQTPQASNRAAAGIMLNTALAALLGLTAWLAQHVR